MVIKFRTTKLQKQYENWKQAEKAYGTDVARRYIERVNIIKRARDIRELCTQHPSLRCHPLKGERQGQWAIRITGFYRLIFTLDGEHLDIAQVEEVSKHYGD
jgi:proteic killer suppression protein